MTSNKPPTVNRPKRHHFVPEFILENFADADGRLFFFSQRVPAKGVQRTTPANIFAETHLYSEILDDGTRDPVLEERLSKLEAAASLVIRRAISAVRSGRLPNLNDEERNIWSDFFVVQWRRVPDVNSKAVTPEEFDEKVRSIVSELKASGSYDLEEIAELEDATQRPRLIHNSRLGAIAAPKSMIKNVLVNRGLGFARIISNKKSFIIGSNPIAILNFGSGTNLLAPDSEAWFPVASDIAMGLGGRKGEETIYDISDHSLVRRVNLHVANRSTLIASRSHALTKSVSSSR